METQTPPVFRFAPSPNGALHLGHAYSALLNYQMAREAGGTFLVRIEDIDRERCRPELEAQMLLDLEWLGLEWDDQPRRQSENFEDYRAALAELDSAGLIFPSFMSRSDIQRAVKDMGKIWPTDPDNAPLYPGNEKQWSKQKRMAHEAQSPVRNWRLSMDEAIVRCGGMLHWTETGFGPGGETGKVTARPQDWGDVVIARAAVATSYHLSVVVDDAAQGVTHVVRGLDVFHATSVHRVLQQLLDLPVPHYHHHRLVLDDNGRKLSKSDHDTSLSALRAAGLQPADIKRMVGL